MDIMSQFVFLVPNSLSLLLSHSPWKAAAPSIHTPGTLPTLTDAADWTRMVT